LAITSFHINHFEIFLEHDTVGYGESIRIKVKGMDENRQIRNRQVSGSSPDFGSSISATSFASAN
jgi:hypothetical protein